MSKESAGLKSWRRKQPRGAIMKPETFDKIVADMMAKGYSRERAEKIAGSAYWGSAESKYKSYQHHKYSKKGGK